MKALLLTLFVLFGTFGFTQKAQARDNCEYTTRAILDANLVGPMNQVSRMAIFNLIKDCALTAANAAWESVKSVGSCIMHPIDCAESAVDGIKNAYHFITNIAEEMRKIWGTISNLTPQQMGEMLCTVIGSIAPDIIVAILTAGAASGKLGITIAKIMLKIKKMVAVLRETIALPIKMLAKLGEEALENIAKAMRSKFKGEFELEIRRMGCAIR